MSEKEAFKILFLLEEQRRQLQREYGPDGKRLTRLEREAAQFLARRGVQGPPRASGAARRACAPVRMSNVPDTAGGALTGLVVGGIVASDAGWTGADV